MKAVSQPLLEALLLREAKAYRAGESYMANCQLMALRDEGDHVVASVMQEGKDGKHHCMRRCPCARA